MFVCIPTTGNCDGVPNCNMAEDENCAG